MSEALLSVVGTAGHIDHGKTALVRALTGVDCDRLPAEQERGITIDLGFAHVESDGVHLGFVDVPGHERFVRNMLAGATGIDICLLVVAADESVMPQTREHLDICRFLDLERGVIAITRCDLAEPDLIELVRLEVESLVEGTFLENAPVIETSAETGQGRDELLAALTLAARSQPRTERRLWPARLPVDRAFVMRGFGPVVTGTLVEGVIREGDRLRLLPADEAVRVRGIQVHGAARPEARAGERTSLNLAGVEIARLQRGQTIAAPGACVLERTLTVALETIGTLPRPIEDGSRARFHLGSAEVLGRIHLPGRDQVGPEERVLAQIFLDAPTAVRGGDRFVLRSLSPVLTIGGGQVLDPRQKRISGREPWFQEAERVLLEGSVEERFLQIVQRGGRHGVTVESLTGRFEPSHDPGAVREALVASGAIEEFGGVLFLPHIRQDLEDLAQRLLAGIAKINRTATSMPRSEFKQRLLGHLEGDAAEALLQLWSDEETVPITRDRVGLPGRAKGLPVAESRSAEQIVALYIERGLAGAPSPAQASRDLALKPQIVEGLIRYLVDEGRLVRLPGEWVVAATAVTEVATRLRESGEDFVDIAIFKEMFGLSRKLAIPLLEHLDEVGVTRRDGNRRRIL